MFRQQDPNTYSLSQVLYLKDKDGYQEIGILETEYSASLYDDVQAPDKAAVARPQNQQFLLRCTQRVSICNTGNLSVAPITPTDGERFDNYPALLNCDLTIETEGRPGLTFDLLDYSPKTVNTAIQTNTSNSQSAGSVSGTTTSSTTGSSMSESTTYGTTVTLGDTFSGVSANYEHTSTSTTEQSATTGRERSSSASRDSGSGASMSIKDWGAYATFNPKLLNPSWVFGQEFPWNAVECRYAYTGVPYPKNPNQLRMYVSDSMLANLFDGNFLYPPSELSQFSLSFVMKTSWRIYLGYAESSEIEIDSDIDYFSASHCVDDAGKSALVYLDQTGASLCVKGADGSYSDTPSATVDLNILALDPIGRNAKAAVVGFLPGRFIPPVSGGPLPQGFKILSSTNDLQVEDTTAYPSGAVGGLSAAPTRLTAAWSAQSSFPYQLTLYFKILDAVENYNLFIKSWKVGATGLRLTFVINGDTDNAIVKYVDAEEAAGGDNNLMAISLRNLDFASVDYHDYLQLGLNSIQVTLEPIDDQYAGCEFQVRALSIELG